MEERAPDTKFFEIAEDGPVFVKIEYNRLAGSKDFKIANSVAELASLVSQLPCKTRVSITPCLRVEATDTVYTVTDGVVVRGSY